LIRMIRDHQGSTHGLRTGLLGLCPPAVSSSIPKDNLP
jgi:hypothetical protein